VLEDPETSRKLILSTNQPVVRMLVVRATDVPTYVQQRNWGQTTVFESGRQSGGLACCCDQGPMFQAS